MEWRWQSDCGAKENRKDAGVVARNLALVPRTSLYFSRFRLKSNCFAGLTWTGISAKRVIAIFFAITKSKILPFGDRRSSPALSRCHAKL